MAKPENHALERFCSLKDIIAALNFLGYSSQFSNEWKIFNGGFQAEGHASLLGLEVDSQFAEKASFSMGTAFSTVLAPYGAIAGSNIGLAAGVGVAGLASAPLTLPILTGATIIGAVAGYISTSIAGDYIGSMAGYALATLQKLHLSDVVPLQSSRDYDYFGGPHQQRQDELAAADNAERRGLNSRYTPFVPTSDQLEAGRLEGLRTSFSERDGNDVAPSLLQLPETGDQYPGVYNINDLDDVEASNRWSPGVSSLGDPTIGRGGEDRQVPGYSYQGADEGLFRVSEKDTSYASGLRGVALPEVPGQLTGFSGPSIGTNGSEPAFVQYANVNSALTALYYNNQSISFVGQDARITSEAIRGLNEGIREGYERTIGAEGGFNGQAGDGTRGLADQNDPLRRELAEDSNDRIDDTFEQFGFAESEDSQGFQLPDYGDSLSDYFDPSAYYSFEGTNDPGGYNPGDTGWGDGDWGDTGWTDSGWGDTDYGFTDYGFTDYGYYDYGYSDYGYSDYGFSDFDWAAPIVIGFSNGSARLINTAEDSSVWFDMSGDGIAEQTQWAAKGNGVLAIDANQDGKIDQRSEVVFTDWDATAKSDIEALRHVFDSNGDKYLTSADARWNDFRVVVDGQARTLAEA